MPAPKKAQTVAVGRGRTTLELASPELLPEEPEDFELESAATELESNEGATVTVYRQGAHGRDWTFIDTMPPANYSLVMLKHPPYSGGKFRIVMRHADGTIRLNRVVQVEPAPAPPASPSAPASPLGGEAGIAILGKAMVEGFSRMGDALGKLGELIVTNRPAPVEQKGLRDLLGDVQVLKELLTPVRAETDPLEMLSRLLGVVKELPGRGGDDDDRPARGRATEMDVLLETARAILPQLASATQHQPQLPAPINAAPRVPPQPTGVQPEPQPQLDPTRLMLNFLVQQAANKNDPEPYAVMVLDNVPPGIIDQYMNRADWFEELCKVAPQATPFREWFERLRGQIVNYLTNDETPVQTGGATVQGTAPPNAAAPGS